MASRKNKVILIAAGGSGGHILPALSMAHALKKKDFSYLPSLSQNNKNSSQKWDIEFVSGYSALEKKLFSDSGFLVHNLSVGRLRKNVSLKERIKTVLLLPFSLLKAFFLILKLKPALVLGSGGAVSGPVLLAGILLRKKTVIFEPNVVPGFANRKLAGFVDYAILVFTSTKKYLKAKKVFMFPYPVRSEIASLTPKTHFNKPLKVLVMGGSQGALQINQTVSDFITLNQSIMGDLFSFTLITGAKDFDHFKKFSQNLNHVKVIPFTHKIYQLYKWADLVIGRAGAGFLAELSASARAGLLIPLAHSADNHQLKNALELKALSVALMIEEKHFNPLALKNTLYPLLEKPEQLKKMSLGIQALKLGAVANPIALHLIKTVG